MVHIGIGSKVPVTPFTVGIECYQLLQYLHAIFYLFSSLKIIFLMYKVGSQTRLSIDVEVEKTSEARLYKMKLHLMMPSEARQNFI